MSDRAVLQLRYLEAKARREELAADQLQTELDKLSQKIPFYKDPNLFKPLLAGIATATLFSGYFQYIFIPSSLKLQQERDTEAMVARLNASKHQAESARYEFLLEKLSEKIESTKESQAFALLKLEGLKKQNNELLKTLSDIPKTKENSNKVSELTKTASENADEISVQIANTKRSSNTVDGISDALSISKSSIEGNSGWIYVGYYPNDKWNNTNLKITSGLPLVGEIYEIDSDAPVSKGAPKFSIFGYRFEKHIGTVVSGQKIKVLNVTEVGLSKVWAKIELVK